MADTAAPVAKPKAACKKFKHKKTAVYPKTRMAGTVQEYLFRDKLGNIKFISPSFSFPDVVALNPTMADRAAPVAKPKTACKKLIHKKTLSPSFSFPDAVTLNPTMADRAAPVAKPKTAFTKLIHKKTAVHPRITSSVVNGTLEQKLHNPKSGNVEAKQKKAGKSPKKARADTKPKKADTPKNKATANT